MMTALPHEDPRIGSVLDGRYRILSRLSTGGMGVVYRGERLKLGRPVAIKFLLAQLTHEPAQRACFEREARVMSRLNHPHCVPVTDFGVSDAPYLVMEYVSGRTLKQVLAHERISPARAVRLMRQLLSGLSHAHAQGIVHHDIKPANIMLTEATGVGEQVRVLDFGLAKWRETADDGEPTAPALLAGTPQYMAPEQWQQAGLVDPRSDLYAAGVVLFEMLTGQKPFEGREPFEVLRAHAELPPPTLESVCPRLRGLAALEAIVQRALQKAPDARFASASEFADALEALPPLPETLDDELDVHAGSEADAFDHTMAATRALPEKPAPALIVTAQSTPKRASSPRRYAWLSVPVAACVWLGWNLGSSRHGAASNSARNAHAPAVQVALNPVAKAESLPDEDAPAPEERAPTQDAVSEPRERPTVETLIEQGEIEMALAELENLRAVEPTNARLLYLEGRALFEKGWWREAYERYREAMRRDGNYRFDRQLTSHLVRGLGSSSAAAMAREILRDDLGQDALRPLARAARNDHRSVVRAEAQRLHDEIARATR